MEEKQALAHKTERQLKRIAESLGLEHEWKTRIEGAEIDAVWFKTFPPPLSRIPIVGFEIETSKRTSKHIKGDIFNLLSLHPSIGVMIFIKKGYADEKEWTGNMKGAEKFAEEFKGLSRILVWSEEEVEKMVKESKITS